MTHAGLPRARGTQTTTIAASVVAGRILLRTKPKFAEVPAYLPPQHSGLVVAGTGATTRTRQLRSAANAAQLPLLADTALYTGVNGIAAVDRPLILPRHEDALPLDEFMAVELDTLLDAQLAAGASAALVPFGYVFADEQSTLRAIVAAAKTIERNDVIVVLPVDGAWLTRPEALGRLIKALQQISHPVLILFGGQWNTVFDSATGVAHLRRLLAETNRVGLGAGDVLAGFDCMANGGLCAVVGAGGSLRHLVPPDKTATASRPQAHFPSVFLPDLLQYLNADTLADTYAAQAPTCDCLVCNGRSLGRFHSRLEAVRQEAHSHNAAAWAKLLEEFQEQPQPQRRDWWEERCQTALDTYAVENARIRARNALKPTPHLKRLVAGRPQTLVH